MKSVFAKAFQPQADAISKTVAAFDTSGDLLVKGKRNTLKTFPLPGITLNIKAFKVPHLFNAIVYRYLRPSKARRSFEYAQKLTDLGIGTPQPIAYFEEGGFLLGQSFYVCEHLEADFTFRALVDDANLPDRTEIARAFARFFFKVHESGVEFIDNTPGNTLIKKTESGYEFYLVDLNRMNFRQLTEDERLRNLAKITCDPSLLKPIGDEYAKLYGKNPSELKAKLNQFVDAFQEKLRRRKAFKKKYLGK